MSRRAAGFLAGAWLAAAAASAHDFWIEPSTFRPAAGARVAVSLRVGQDFRGEPVPRNPAAIERFALVTDRGEAAIDGLPGMDPAGETEPLAAPGLAWIVYRSKRSPLRLEADKFEKYLAEEGLETVSAARRARGESGNPGREVFSRSVKALLFAGDVPAEAKGFDRAAGLTLEVLLRADPRRAVPGKLPIRLLSDGRPLAGALVTALQASPPTRVSARTDARGDAALELPRKGAWLVKAVRMTPAPSGVDADWESVWTSVTFEVP
jgi:uncharacterized GH25 family protein